LESSLQQDRHYRRSLLTTLFLLAAVAVVMEMVEAVAQVAFVAPRGLRQVAAVELLRQR
jgi:hypothetical protein